MLMIFHSGDRKLYDAWMNREAKITKVTIPWPNTEEIMHATYLLDRDNIRWFIGMNGSKYVVCRSFIEKVKS